MKTQGITIKTALLTIAVALTFIFTTQASSPETEKRSMEVGVYKLLNDQSIKVHFDNKLGGKVTIKILDLDGNIIYEEKIKDTQVYIRKFNLKDLATGTYIVEVANKNYLTRKTVKI